MLSSYVAQILVEKIGCILTAYVPMFSKRNGRSEPLRK